MYVALVLNINFEFLLGKASAQIDSGIWILPHILDYSKWPQVSQKLEKSQKNEGEWAGQWDLSKNAIKREHRTKTLSVRFFTRFFAQPVRLPQALSRYTHGFYHFWSTSFFIIIRLLKPLLHYLKICYHFVAGSKSTFYVPHSVKYVFFSASVF